MRDQIIRELLDWAAHTITNDSLDGNLAPEDQRIFEYLVQLNRELKAEFGDVGMWPNLFEAAARSHTTRRSQRRVRR